MQRRKSYRVHYIIVIINEIPAHTTRAAGGHYYTLNYTNGREGRVRGREGTHDSTSTPTFQKLILLRLFKVVTQ